MFFSVYQVSKYLLRDFWLEYGDPRTTSKYWIAQNGLVHTALILTVYIALVTVIGPWVMRHRKPLVLKTPMLCYNLFMTVANMYAFYRSLVLLRFGLDLLNFDCPLPTDTSVRTLEMISDGHFYLWSKFIDLFDTIFFVLRKKNSQLTFLHLYHHSVVPGLGIVAFLLYPTGTPVGMFVILNSMIHSLMYAYYGLAAMGPAMSKYLWWKKYITQVQIVQFFVYMVYAAFFFFLQRGYSQAFILMGCSQAPFFAYLFIRFYNRSYQHKALTNGLTAKMN